MSRGGSVAVVAATGIAALHHHNPVEKMEHQTGSRSGQEHHDGHHQPSVTVVLSEPAFHAQVAASGSHQPDTHLGNLHVALPLQLQVGGDILIASYARF